MRFEDMNLSASLRKAVAEMGFTEATTIQSVSLPVIMSGRDVLGIAQTGTGKTLAYLIGAMNTWKYMPLNPPQIIVLVPTRELVVQVVEVAKQLASRTNMKCVGVFGGVGMMPQAQAVSEGADVLVATPGRLLDLVLDGYVSLRNVKKLVVDEVDEMLEQGFRTQLGRIFDLLPKRRQNLLFSATMTPDIEALTATYFTAPVKVEAAPTGTPLAEIAQGVYRVPNFNTKLNLLRMLLADADNMKRVMVFVGSMALADKVYESIESTFEGEIDYIHSKRTQSQRFRAVRGFADGDFRILIATDVVARGIDVSGVSHVINFDLPLEAEQYMHRIGRTGRAGERGVAWTLCSDAETTLLDNIEALMNISVEELALPEELEVSDVLTAFELPTYRMKNTLTQTDVTPGGAFHEKAEKNKKVNKRIHHADLMRQKYGKPQTRGDKRQNNKKKR